MTLSLTVLATDSRAWDYSEHVRVSFDSFDVACSESDYESGLAKQICDTRSLQLCYAHMVALAGDHTSNIGSLASPAKGLLQDPKNGVDCSNIQSILDGTTSSASSLPDRIGIANRPGIAGALAWIALLPDNIDHFPPRSRTVWVENFSHALTGGDLSLQERFAAHAFSMHFLQDTFAAGHNGLRRGEKRQDLDQAYHDDFNATGIFLRNANNDVWHTYGDKHLDVPSIHLEIDPCADLDSSSLISLLEAELGDEYDVLTASAYEALCAKKGLKAISLSQQSSVSLIQPCFYWDNCGKTEVLLGFPVNSIQEYKSSMRCEEVEGSVVSICTGNHAIVREATASSIAALLRALDTDRKDQLDVAAEIESVARNFPNGLRTIAYQEGRTAINKTSFVLNYSDWIDIDDFSEYRVHPFRNWQFSLYRRSSALSSLSDNTLAWGLRPGQTDQKWWSFDLRFDVASDDGNFADGFELNGGLEAPRFWHRVFGASVRAVLGADDIWSGTAKRNWFYGGGVEVDLHIGKTVVFVNALRLSHQLAGSRDTYSDQFTVGVRVGSVALRGRPSLQ